MDKTQEDIIRFELMLRTSDREQRARACDGLQVIVEKWQGTPYGKRAKQLLEKNCRSGAPEKNPELSAFVNRWVGIHKLTDVGLLDFLAELQSKPAIAARLRREVIEDLRQWVSDAVPRIGPQTPAEEIKALNGFVAVVSSLGTYEAEMEELKQLRGALFQVSYEKVRRRITAALSTWSFDEAWEALQQLSKPPASFERDVAQLQEEIYEADQTRQEVVRLFDKLPQDSPESWAAASRLIDYVREIPRYLHDAVPSEWRQRLEAARRRCVQEVARFLEKEAGKTFDLRELREFQAAYEKLEGEGRDAEVLLRKEWFQSALDLLSQNVGREVSGAGSPEALDVICLGLSGERAGLPDIFVEVIDTFRTRIDEISASWKAIRTGGDFPDPMPSGGPMPEAFLKAVAFFKERLDRVKEAFEKLEVVDEDATGQAYVEAAGTADEILKELGNHALALELKEKARRKITHHQIGAAAVECRIDQLLELCRPHKEDPVCGYYIAHERQLRALRELVMEKAFSGSHEAEGWWQSWRARCESLRADMPEALSRMLEREQEKRTDQWHALLATLMAEPLPPEKCEEIAASLIAASLKGELKRLDLEWRLTGFLQKAAVGYAERFIKSKNWQRAAEKIAELDEDHEDARRLKTLLAVERARETGVVALSQVLKRDWTQISSYLGEEAHGILAGAVAEAWERGEEETLTNLRMVVSRLLATGNAPAEFLKEFARWEEWLAVEGDVRSGGGMACVKKLVSYLEARPPHDAVLGKQLGRLVSYWLERKNVVMLTWAYEAFGDYAAVPAGNPVEDLKEQNLRLALGCEQMLRSDERLELAHLKAMQDGLKKAEEEWAELTDYLNELPRVVTGTRLPARYHETKELLSQLIETWATLDHLKNADFRQEVERERLDACRRDLASKFDGLAVQKKLFEQERRLEPLTNLNFLQNRVMDAADACGDDDRWDEKGVFGELADCLRNMEALLRRVGAEGGVLWSLISQEYCLTVHARAGSLLPRPSPPDLSELTAQFAQLEAEEERFRRLWQGMINRKPVVPPRSSFNPESYLDYLGLFPEDPPHSRRGYLQFKRSFAMSEPIPTILAQSRRYLPEWICKYLDEGIPLYASEA